MDGRKRLPDAELSVMQAVWAHGGEVSRGDIEGALASHGWSVNTINTYLTRLCDKGYLSARREGRATSIRRSFRRRSTASSTAEASCSGSTAARWAALWRR